MQREKLDLLVQYYKKYLFSLPNWKILLIIRPIPLIILIYIFNSFIPLFLLLYDILHKIIDNLSKTKIFNKRRLLGLGIFASIFSLLATLIEYLFFSKISIYSMIISYVIPFIIISIGLYNVILSFIYIILAFMLNAFLSSLPYGTSYAHTIAFRCFVLAVVVSAAYCLLKSNAQLFKLGKKFFNYWLTGNSEVFEQELLKLSKLSEIIIYNIIFTSNENKVKCVITIPYVHPGPFRNIGSSSLPYLLIDSISSKLSCPVIVLHGACDHTLDLVSRREAEEMAKNLSEHLLSESSTEILLSHFASLSNNGIVLYYTSIIDSSQKKNFSKNIVFVEDNSGLIDDIPHSLQSSLSEKALLIDCHSSFTEKTSSQDINSVLLKALTRVLEERLKPSETLSVGSSSIRSPEIFYLTKGEICEGGLSALVLDYGTEKILIVVYDSNNIVLSVRKKLQEHLREKYGFSKVIICSTDTHRYTGHIKGRGYSPLGEKTDLNTIISLTEKAVEDALGNITRVKAKLSVFSKECRVLGEKVYEVSSYTARAVKITILLLFTLFVLALI